MKEGLYRQYFEQMPCYISVQDRDFRIIDANNRFLNDFGEGVGRHCYEIYKQRPDKCGFCPVELTFRDGQRYGSEEVVQTRNGKMVSVIVYTTPIRDESGEVSAVMEMSTDVTELKILQERLRQSQERYRLLFDEVPCYISIQDRDFNLVEVNRRFREDFGEADGHCYEIYKHRSSVCDTCPVNETFSDGNVHESEEVVTSRSGEQINVLCITAPLRDSHGSIHQVMEMSANITQIRKLQSQLTSIGLLISSVSHGLKGLLNGLEGGIYLVNSGLEKNDSNRLEKGWEMVQRNVGRIRSMVMDILYYAKEREPQYKKLSAVDVFNEASGVMEKKMEDLGIDFRRKAADEAGELDADHNAVRALLVNILENSLEACRMDSSNDNPRIDFALKGLDDKVVFEISDNGIGMDTETREKLFTLFFSSKGTEGTGLGMFVANQIAKQHGGYIQVDSETGEGSRFSIVLPRNRASPASASDAG